MLEALNLAPGPAEGLARYLDLLDRWARKVNLTGARSPEERVQLLVQDVLPAAPLLGGKRLLDLGSGNGSPGLVLALLRPDLQVTLLEPRQRRWAFLREATRLVGRPEIEVCRLRHDAWPGPPADNLTVRGLRLSVESLLPLLAAGGQLLVFGPAPAAAGLRQDVVGEGRARICRLRRRCST